MKYFLLAGLLLAVFSCQKETGITAQPDTYWAHVRAALKDSLPGASYAAVDLSKAFKTIDSSRNLAYLRLGFRAKPFKTDFIVLKTDNPGNILAGRVVHIDRQSGNRQAFNGAFQLSSLDEKTTRARAIADGRFRDQQRKTDPDGAAGTQELPPAVVTSYTYSGDLFMEWYQLAGMFGDDGSPLYVADSPGGGGGGAQPDQTIELEPEYTDGKVIQVADYLRCFGALPPAGATFEISILADIPVNGDPSKMFSWKSGSPGHSFIQLKAASGGQSVQQNIGFYPTTGWKTVMQTVTSMTEDNGGHEFNAQLTIRVDAQHFQKALDMMQLISSRSYDLATFNCTDFALRVFNAAHDEPLLIPQYTAPGYSVSSNTPQGLYNEIKMLESSGNKDFGTAILPGVAGFVGDSHGACN